MKTVDLWDLFHGQEVDDLGDLIACLMEALENKDRTATRQHLAQFVVNIVDAKLRKANDEKL